MQSAEKRILKGGIKLHGGEHLRGTGSRSAFVFGPNGNLRVAWSLLVALPFPSGTPKRTLQIARVGLVANDTVGISS